MTYGRSIEHPYTPIDQGRTGYFEGVGSQTVSHVVGVVPLIGVLQFYNLRLTGLADVALEVNSGVRTMYTHIGHTTTTVADS